MESVQNQICRPANCRVDGMYPAVYPRKEDLDSHNCLKRDVRSRVIINFVPPTAPGDVTSNDVALGCGQLEGSKLYKKQEGLPKTAEKSVAKSAWIC